MCAFGGVCRGSGQVRGLFGASEGPTAAEEHRESAEHYGGVRKRESRDLLCTKRLYDSDGLPLGPIETRVYRGRSDPRGLAGSEALSKLRVKIKTLRRRGRRWDRRVLRTGLSLMATGYHAGRAWARSKRSRQPGR